MPKRGRRIQALIRADFERGLESERRVEEALQLLVVSGTIHNYYHSEQEGELDRQGIDFLVFYEPDRNIPLQVKSSAQGKEYHVEQYGFRIKCVVAEPSLSPLELAKEILRELDLPVKELDSPITPIEETLEEALREILEE